MRIRSSAGFTLVELMIVVAILGILLLVVAPDFGRFVADGRVNAAKDKLIASISLARTEAIKRGERVVVCRANAAGTGCDGGGTDWSAGWLVFADLNENGNLDGGIAGNEIIRVQTDIDAQTSIQYTRNDAITYDGRGMLITAAAGDQSFTVGDTGVSTVETGLSVRSTGRIRSCANWNVSTHTCADN